MRQPDQAASGQLSVKKINLKNKELWRLDGPELQMLCSELAKLRSKIEPYADLSNKFIFKSHKITTPNLALVQQVVPYFRRLTKPHNLKQPRVAFLAFSYKVDQIGAGGFGVVYQAFTLKFKQQQSGELLLEISDSANKVAKISKRGAKLGKEQMVDAYLLKKNLNPVDSQAIKEQQNQLRIMPKTKAVIWIVINSFVMPVIVSPLLPGKTVATLNQDPYCFSFEERCLLALNFCRALHDDFHSKSYVHRDLNLKNVLLDIELLKAQGVNTKVKLAHIIDLLEVRPLGAYLNNQVGVWRIRDVFQYAQQSRRRRINSSYDLYSAGLILAHIFQCVDLSAYYSLWVLELCLQRPDEMNDKSFQIMNIIKFHKNLLLMLSQTITLFSKVGLISPDVGEAIMTLTRPNPLERGEIVDTLATLQNVQPVVLKPMAPELMQLSSEQLHVFFRRYLTMIVVRESYADIKSLILARQDQPFSSGSIEQCLLRALNNTVFSIEQLWKLYQFIPRKSNKDFEFILASLRPLYCLSQGARPANQLSLLFEEVLTILAISSIDVPVKITTVAALSRIVNTILEKVTSKCVDLIAASNINQIISHIHAVKRLGLDGELCRKIIPLLTKSPVEKGLLFESLLFFGSDVFIEHCWKRNLSDTASRLIEIENVLKEEAPNNDSVLLELMGQISGSDNQSQAGLNLWVVRTLMAHHHFNTLHRILIAFAQKKQLSDMLNYNEIHILSRGTKFLLSTYQIAHNSDRNIDEFTRNFLNTLAQVAEPLAIILVYRFIKKSKDFPGFFSFVHGSHDSSTLFNFRSRSCAGMLLKALARQLKRSVHGQRDNLAFLRENFEDEITQMLPGDYKSPTYS